MSSDKHYCKERYHLLREQGICVRCAKVDAEPGFQTCIPCREQHRVRQLKRRALTIYSRTINLISA